MGKRGIGGANAMNYKVSIKYCVAIAMMLLLSACVGTPKKSVWYSPTALPLEQVYKAAITAGADNGFSVDNPRSENTIASVLKNAITMNIGASESLAIASPIALKSFSIERL